MKKVFQGTIFLASCFTKMMLASCWAVAQFNAIGKNYELYNDLSETFYQNTQGLKKFTDDAMTIQMVSRKPFFFKYWLV